MASRGFLDILLENQKGKFLCAIENKVDASEHSDQLGRYKKALDKKYPEDFTKHYVFLSPGGIPPEQEEDRRHWVRMEYATILKLVEDTLENGKTAGMRKDVRVFLRQYATTLRRNIVHKHPEKVRELARKIYLENRESIELIYLHKPDYQAEMKEILRNVVREHSDWRLDTEDKYIIRFRHEAWENLPGFQTGTGWKASKSLLLFEFLLHDGIKNARMVLCLGPGENKSIRQEIFQKINDVDRNLFNHTNYSSNLPPFSDDGYMHIYFGKNILDEEDFGKWDDNERSHIRDRVKHWVKCFTENDFRRLNDIIVDCFKEYEAQQADSSDAGRVR